MDRRHALSELLRHGYAQQLAFVARLTPAERERRGRPDAWAAKDLIAHIAFWNGRLADELGALASGRSPHVEQDYDHENAGLFARFRDASWEAVLDAAATTQGRLLASVLLLDGAALERPETLGGDRQRPLWEHIASYHSHALIHLAEHKRGAGQNQEASALLAELARSTLELDDNPTWRGAALYNLACSEALCGDNAQAIATLRQALTLNPALVPWSQEDADLASLRPEPGYQALYTSGAG